MLYIKNNKNYKWNENKKKKIKIKKLECYGLCGIIKKLINKKK